MELNQVFYLLWYYAFECKPEGKQSAAEEER